MLQAEAILCNIYDSFLDATQQPGMSVLGPPTDIGDHQRQRPLPEVERTLALVGGISDRDGTRRFQTAIILLNCAHDPPLFAS